MSIIIKLDKGIITRSTSAGKTDTGQVAFMGGSFYIPKLDNKFKDGEHSEIEMTGRFNGQYGLSTTEIISAKSVSKP